MFLLCSALYYVGKKGISCTIRVFFLKERPCFLPFYLPILSTFYSLLKRSTWVLTLKISLHIPFIIWRIWLSTKTGVKSSFSYFGHFHTCDIIWWLEERKHVNMALWPVGRWLCHCLGNKPWIIRGTSGVPWMIYISLCWSNIHSTNKGCSHSCWPWKVTISLFMSA